MASEETKTEEKPDEWNDWIRHSETVRVRDSILSTIEKEIEVLISQAIVSSDPKVAVLGASIRMKRSFVQKLSPKKQEEDDDEDDSPEDSD